MVYILSFLEGFLAFISPCILPLLPIYLTYLSGNMTGTGKSRLLSNAAGFVAGFTLVFMLLGVGAGFLQLTGRYLQIVNILGGLILILFGLQFTGLVRLKLLDMTARPEVKISHGRFWPSVLMGIVFAFSWSPCVGTFLGMAMMSAANAATMGQGLVMLLLFCLGLGLPFILSALIMDKLEHAFSWMKRHYQIITMGSGIFLILMGLLLMSGLLNKVIGLLL